ncbi:uncharacterized protein LOC112689005 [Sipha flava]|uniref:Uncharacterized protein LOC112689005 n=1 Tax=Sipha flava TaxID=143950 RepID=A0A2S2QES8_9HEMI|nr:uncharacterized protein LOC112689005 [Sipha flava]
MRGKSEGSARRIQKRLTGQVPPKILKSKNESNGQKEWRKCNQRSMCFIPRLLHKSNNGNSAKTQRDCRVGHNHDLYDAEEIIGAKKTVDDELMFLVKWISPYNCYSFIYNDDAKRRFPQLVITFYERHLMFKQ